MDGTLLSHVSLLLWQTILKVRKPEFDTASGLCFAKNKCCRPEFGPELSAKCIPEFIIPETVRSWQPIFGNIFSDAGPVLGRI